VKYEIIREQIYTITCDNAANIIKMTRIMTVNDIGNDFVDLSDEFNNNTPDIKNEDIENELLIDLFNTGIFVKIIWFTKLKKII